MTNPNTCQLSEKNRVYDEDVHLKTEENYGKIIYSFYVGIIESLKEFLYFTHDNVGNLCRCDAEQE